ncbi:MAG: hypothetical protein A2008_11755 [Candidatus Wallbacteria bacterium GWC2_49_35]|uniref:Uncharacterized protein n=1 Tax=Candidatus Wallbacteria bacterium GWC2_49_35 TaxID=1817813 RepID=A0A1F7WHR2_9BACT|nr:MAG: hypothetical protein A2008_11755 [Candidatus Wallbacteria bacterium GWC2_49_35]HBC75152.1 hypothetical protein [Candidatus Wallbacteria bacterium]
MINKNANYYIIIYFLLIFAAGAVFSGCGDKGQTVNVEPGVVEFQRTLNINDYINLSGDFCDANPVNSQTAYDLNFFYAGSSAEIGLRGGYYDSSGVKYYLKFSDLGAVKYDIVDTLPAISAYNSYYTDVKTNVAYLPETSSVTLLKMNHVYSIYKWTAYGGNYAKIIIDYIDSTNRNVTIRGAYQQRQGYNLLY